MIEGKKVEIRKLRSLVDLNDFHFKKCDMMSITKVNTRLKSTLNHRVPTDRISKHKWTNVGKIALE